jgi:polyhydroxyalkanoate synthase subunit PhaC
MSSKSRAQPAVPDLGAAAEALGSNVGETMKALAGLKLPFDTMSRLQGDYLKQATELWNQSLHALQPCADPPATVS